jgi:hypothetical protein
VVNIEIVPPKPARRPRSALSLLGWVIIALLLMAALGHAQPRHGHGPNQPPASYPWPQSTVTTPDGSGGYYTYPQDRSGEGSGHGCHSYGAGAWSDGGPFYTNCW